MKAEQRARRRATRSARPRSSPSHFSSSVARWKSSHSRRAGRSGDRNGGSGRSMVMVPACPAGRSETDDAVSAPAATRCLTMLSAEPARNHSICSSLKVCVPSKSMVVPSGLMIRHVHRDVGRELGQAEHVDAVVLADQVVGGGVGEGERHQSLLLQVGLVDAGEAAGEDHLAVAEPGLHRGVLTARALAVVLVADGAPRDALLGVALAISGNGRVGAVGLVLALARGAGEGVDHAEEQVARDVLQVAAVPAATCRRRRCDRWCTCPAPSSARAGRGSPGRPTAANGVEQLQAVRGRVDHRPRRRHGRRAGR